MGTQQHRAVALGMALGTLLASGSAGAAEALGYYRQPAAGPNEVVFVAEGDLWAVGYGGGTARRLTAHPGEETTPAISADGRWVAFVGRYEGRAEVYLMPATGGAPRRLTYDGGQWMRIEGFTPDGKVLYASTRWNGKPGVRLYTVDPATGTRAPLPLAEAAEACRLGDQLVFSRLPQHGDNVRGYRGGLQQKLWQQRGAGEAQPFFANADFTSRQPMCWEGRVYFLSDRDGTMNVWSADANGGDLRQLTRHQDFDIRTASLAAGRIVYQHAGRVRVLTLASGGDAELAVNLSSDFDHLRPRWVKNPFEYLTGYALSPNGDRLALLARGYVTVLPTGSGRRVEAARDSLTRVREVAFTHDGKGLLSLSDGTGEVELWRYPANGIGAGEALTKDAKSLLLKVLASPDGRYVAYTDRAHQLWLYDGKTRQQRVVAKLPQGGFGEMAWSPDGRWLAYTAEARNDFNQLWLLSAESGQSTALTSDRYDARYPEFSPDGRILYFLGDRNLQSVVTTPWGQRDPAPFFDRQAKVYGLLLDPAAPWPFEPRNELLPAEPPKPAEPAKSAEASDKGAGDKNGKPAEKTAEKLPEKAPDKPAAVKPANVVLADVSRRQYEVPVPPGNYTHLSTDGKRLYLLRAETAAEPKKALVTLSIEAPNPTPPTVEIFYDDIHSYQLSQDRKKVLVRRFNPATKDNQFWLFDAGAKAPADVTKSVVNLRDWVLEVDPRAEWRQMFVDAWRLHRDHVHPATLAKTDWRALRAKFEPLVERVTDRAELSDVLAQLASHVGILHSQVVAQDVRKGPDEIEVGALAADLTPTPQGLRVERHYSGDPELLEERSPLAKPGVDLERGDLLTAVNGKPVRSEAELAAALRNQANRQVHLAVRTAAGKERAVIVTPVTAQRDLELRYLGWEWDRYAKVEEAGRGRIGYLHLQAMTRTDIARWAREYYPVFDREGLIIDLRGNSGGNIDRWLIEKLLRRAWVFWHNGFHDERIANPPYAFRGHIVALVDGQTYSDGETMAAGLQRLGIATLIGTPTAGAGMWLGDRSRLRDNGIMRAAELPQFVLDNGKPRWIIEGIGVTPDIRVDNLPAATFRGEDAQLAAAIKLLNERIAADPRPRPAAPASGAAAVWGARH